MLGVLSVILAFDREHPTRARTIITEPSSFTPTKAHLLCVFAGQNQRLTAIGIRAGDDRFLEFRVGTLPSSDIASEDSWNGALRWINACTQNHKRCKIVDSATYVPERLLDVGHAEDAVRLIETTTLSTQEKDTDNAFKRRTSRIGSKFSLKSPADIGASLSETFSKLTFPGSAPRLTRAEPSVKYVTLSHCWGKTKSPLLLTQETYASHTSLNGIPVSQLPRTFQDAIMVTRKLGVRYLWVDSLCIIQDSELDWHTQSAQMSYVYSHSWLTIAATASSSDHDGIFPQQATRESLLRIPRKPVGSGPPVQQVSFDAKEHTVHHEGRRYTVYSRLRRLHPDTSESAFLPRKDKLPLLTRGWIFQERLLSRRVLHFGDTELFWECMEGVSCECSNKDPAEWRVGYDNPERFVGCNDPTKSWYAAMRARKSEQWLFYNDWRRLCQIYSSLELTFARDRLIAISGVAKQFRAVLKDDYLAGCWRKSLDENICWYCTHFPTGSVRPESSMPTWSWASASQGALVWIPCREYLFKILCAQTYPVTDDETGQVSGGRIDLEGLVLNVSLRYRHSNTTDITDQAFCYGLALFDYPSDTGLAGMVMFHPDRQFWTSLDDLVKQFANVTLLLLCRPSSSPPLAGLVLKEKVVNGTFVGFERIGSLSIYAYPDIGGGEGILNRLKDPWTKLTIL